MDAIFALAKCRTDAEKPLHAVNCRKQMSARLDGGEGPAPRRSKRQGQLVLQIGPGKGRRNLIARHAIGGYLGQRMRRDTELTKARDNFCCVLCSSGALPGSLLSGSWRTANCEHRQSIGSPLPDRIVKPLKSLALKAIKVRLREGRARGTEISLRLAPFALMSSNLSDCAIDIRAPSQSARQLTHGLGVDAEVTGKVTVTNIGSPNSRAAASPSNMMP